MNEQADSASGPMVVPYAWVILGAVFFASVVAPFNQFKVPPIMPVLMETFGVNLTQAGVLMSLIAGIGLVLALPSGVILGRFGPKFTGLTALGCLAAGSALGALSGTYGMLLFSRLIEGIGVGLISVVAPATIALWFPPERQGAPMGIWATWVPVGQIFMYNLAPLLVLAAGWQSVWWLGAGYAVVMMVVYGLLIRRPPGESGSLEEQTSPNLRAALKNRQIWLLALSFTCFNLALIGLGTYYPTFLNEVRGYPLGQAALIASIATFMVLISAPAAGWFSDRIGSRRLLISLPFLGLCVLLTLPFVVTGWGIVAVMIVQGLLVGSIPTAIFAAAPEVMRKPQLAGLGLAVILVGQNLGQLIGPVLFAALVDIQGWAAAGYWMIPICLLGFLTGWLVKVR